MEQQLTKFISNQVQTWQPTEINSLTIYRELNEITVNGGVITNSTPHEHCIVEDKNQLSSLVKKVDECTDKGKALKLIELYVIEMFEWFGKEIKPEMIQNLASTIYRNYYWFKIAEFKLFVEKVKSGHWKQVHNISPAVIMERLTDFANDSLELREQIGDAEFVKHENTMSDEVKGLFSEFAQKMAEKYIPQEVKSEHELKSAVDLHAKKVNDWHRDNEFCLKWLRINRIPENLSIRWYMVFLTRKQK